MKIGSDFLLNYCSRMCMYMGNRFKHHSFFWCENIFKLAYQHLKNLLNIVLKRLSIGVINLWGIPQLQHFKQQKNNRHHK